jgi:hypothetical protein
MKNPLCFFVNSIKSDRDISILNSPKKESDFVLFGNRNPFATMFPPIRGNHVFLSGALIDSFIVLFFNICLQPCDELF